MLCSHMLFSDFIFASYSQGSHFEVHAGKQIALSHGSTAMEESLVVGIKALILCENKKRPPGGVDIIYREELLWCSNAICFPTL